VYPAASEPRLLATAIAAYSLLTLLGMARYGTEPWLDQCEVFSVYTGLLSLLAPVEVRPRPDGPRIGLRPPVIGVTRLARRPGQIAFVAALIGVVTFDGLSGSQVWTTRDVAAAERLVNLGVDPYTAGIVVATIGLLLTLAVILATYEAAAWAVGRSTQRVALKRAGGAAAAFAHALVPIALAYFVAHYFALFVFQSQDLMRLASDPFGSGADLFGTADREIDFQLVSPELIWGVQLAAIVVGHVVGLALAHDRALQLTPDGRGVARAQLAMLALMVALTLAGLWSLSTGMATA
jgi:hypothetical protein